MASLREILHVRQSFRRLPNLRSGFDQLSQKVPVASDQRLAGAFLHAERNRQTSGAHDFVDEIDCDLARRVRCDGRLQFLRVIRCN